METQNLDLDEVLKAKDFLPNLLNQTAMLTSQSNQLPTKNEMQFYKQMPSFQQKLQQKLVQLIIVNRKIQQNLIEKIRKLHEFSNPTCKLDLHPIKYNQVVNTLDNLICNVDVTLDTINYVNKENLAVNFIPLEQEEQLKGSQKTKEELPKPQLVYNIPVNNSEFPFVPRIKEKVHSKTELSQDIFDAQNDESKFFQQLSVEDRMHYEFRHPYLREINEMEYLEQQLQLNVEETNYVNLDLLGISPVNYVDTEEGLTELIDHLSKQSEIAIDLEHHHHRSYQGITCLIQISSREKDFIVDPFKLWQLVPRLNQIFANPKIVKVFHGADHDIQWLQRDFGIYVVNMFDTGQASRFLQLESFSLAFLLKKYCNVFANKEYQLADWRMRPLSKKMLKYAREDTHYLLYIYDRLRNDIINQSDQKQEQLQNLMTVLSNSKQVSLILYHKPTLKDQNYYNLINRNKQIGSPNRYKLLKALLKLRDQIARNEDENPRFILPNHILFNLIDRKPSNQKELHQQLGNQAQYLNKYHQQLIDLFADSRNQQKQPNKKTILFQKSKVQFIQPIPSLDLNNLQVLKLQPKSFPLKIENYPSQFFQSPPNPIDSKLNEIKSSFIHHNTTNFLFSLLEKNLQQSFSTVDYNIIFAEQNNSNLTFSMKNLQDELPNIQEANDFIEVPHLQTAKIDSQQKQVVNLPVSLPNIEQHNQQTEIPPSLQQKYGTEIARKKKKLPSHSQKKVKQFNYFSGLNSNLNDQQEENENTKFEINDNNLLQQMNQIRDKINQFEVNQKDPYQQFVGNNQKVTKAQKVVFFSQKYHSFQKRTSKFGKKSKRQFQ